MHTAWIWIFLSGNQAYLMQSFQTTLSSIILLHSVAMMENSVASFQTPTTISHRHSICNRRWAEESNGDPIMMHSSCDGDDETHATAKTALILPNFSPVAWLQQDSWASMSRHEKESFLEHITEGRFQNDRHLSVHDRYYATPSLFSKDVIEFGNGVDRVVLGHGPRRVLILTGIHGNEPCGVEAVKMILRKKKLFSGSNSNVTSEELFQDENWAVPLETLLDSLTIEFLLGNPAALQQNRRFLIRNLNRLFDINKLCDSELADREGYRYELHRARLITESIRHADFVLDIHSCSSDVGAFALPSSLDLSECLAEHLPVKYVIESLVHACLDGGTTLDAAMWNDVPGVCVECGQHRHKDVVSRAVAVISSFLTLQVLQKDGSFATSNSLTSDRPIIMRCNYAERVSRSFEWLQTFPEFHFVAEGEPVFRDADRGIVKCPIEGGAYIVMPTADPVIGEEALFWASAKKKIGN